MQELTNSEKVAYGLGVLAEVARLYRRRGQPPKWISVTDKPNRGVRRGIRLHRNNRTQVFLCSECKLPFLGSSAARCQCKTAKSHKRQDADMTFTEVAP